MKDPNHTFPIEANTKAAIFVTSQAQLYVYSVVTMTACRAIRLNFPDQQVKAVINLTILHHFESCSAAGWCRICKCQIDWLTVRVCYCRQWKFSYLTAYCQSFVCQISKTGFFYRKRFDLRSHQIWDVAAVFGWELSKLENCRFSHLWTCLQCAILKTTLMENLFELIYFHP